MKKIISPLLLVLSTLMLSAQNYPTPEYVNEVSAWVKDSNRVVRLEKTGSKMETKTKVVGGSEMGYTIDDEKSPIRFRLNGAKYSFLYWTGATATGSAISPTADSNMRANGVDPSMFSNMMGMDPSRMITLYKMEPSKGKRKIILAGSPGMFSIGKKNKDSNKYTCSFKKIREGYYEVLVDKTLPQGEYGFVLAGYGGMGDSIIYSFGID